MEAERELTDYILEQRLTFSRHAEQYDPALGGQRFHRVVFYQPRGDGSDIADALGSIQLDRQTGSIADTIPDGVAAPLRTHVSSTLERYRSAWSSAFSFLSFAEGSEE